jgi:hypothetical protein
MLSGMTSTDRRRTFVNFGRGRPWWQNLLFGVIIGAIVIGFTMLYNEVVADGATWPERSVSSR